MKNTQKYSIESENLPAVTFGMLTNQNMYIDQTLNLCVLIRHILCENLVNLYVTKLFEFIFVIFFSDIKNWVTLVQFRIIYLTFSKYFRPLHKQV